MTAQQNNKARMYLSINQYCAKPEHQDAVARIPVFASEYQLFQPIAGKILAEAKRQQEIISTGVTEDKELVRDQMAEKAARVAAAVQTYADVAGDRALFAEVNHPRTDFLNSREIDGANLAETILDIATAKLSLLVGYGVTQAQLDDLDAVIGRFSGAIGKPRGKITDRKTVTDSLPLLFTQADQHLARLDRLTKQLEVTDPEFVLGYRNARQIVDLRGGQSPATDSASAAPSQPMQPVLLPPPVINEDEDEAAA